MESHINEQRLFQSFRELVSIDSPSFSERNMADSLKQRLVKIGFSVEEDDVAEKIGGNSGNLFAVLPGQLDAPPLLLCGHMDTVAPAVGKQAILEPDGRIHSAGDTILGADDLSAICAILEAVTSLEEQGIPHRPIEVLFTVAEETYSDGVLNFDFRKIQAKEAYVLDYDGPIGSAAIAAPHDPDVPGNGERKILSCGLCSGEGHQRHLCRSRSHLENPQRPGCPQRHPELRPHRGRTADQYRPRDLSGQR